VVSVIICTFERSRALTGILNCLAEQTSRDCEVLIIHAGVDSVSNEMVETFRRSTEFTVPVTVVHTEKGLPIQRNAGMACASGDLIVFLDDDVSVAPTFVSRVTQAFSLEGMADVGGITGYDTLHYGLPLPLRYRVRKWLGYYPDLRPGALGLCTCTVPLSFQTPFSGFREIRWLPGFCMAYRRAAVGLLRFDEALPAYGTEDGIFSMSVGRRWRLLMWGDLHVQHHSDPTSRCPPAEAIYGGSFSLSRNYWMQTTGGVRRLRLIRYALAEFALDIAIFFRRPGWSRLTAIAAKQRGLVSGALSTLPRRSAV
jgi:glycosyltransferase involved in cell wall biosynthesis